MNRAGLTVQELSASNPARRFLVEVLRDERRRGHIRYIHGRWEATPQFVATFAAAFGELGRPENGISVFVYDNGRNDGWTYETT